MTTGHDDRLRPLLMTFRERFDVPAVGAAIVTIDGAVTVDAVGHRRRGTPDVVTDDDLWHIGSCGKAITAALYARLVERGEAAWETPIAECFGDVRDSIDPGWGHPSVAEVLVCRSGMRANLSRSDATRAYTDLGSLTEQRTRAVRSALSEPPRNRGRFRYSNLSYVVVGAAIERIAGMPYEDAVRTHLFDPLEITSFGLGPPPNICGHAARIQFGPLRYGKGKPRSPDDVRSDNPGVLTPAGRFTISFADWAKFQRVFLDAEHPALQHWTIDRMLNVPVSKKPAGMAMGWSPASRLGNASFGMQGSNTFWTATALIDSSRRSTAMVVTNDGRPSLLLRTAKLASQILAY